jgi:hypothetical protein
MRKRTVARTVGRLIGVLALIVSVGGCGNGSTPTAPTASVTSVTSVAITGTGALTALGQTSQLTATASLSSGATQNVTSTATWLSSSTSVVTISSAGVLTAVAAGSATITATYQGKAATITAVVTTMGGAILTIASCQPISSPGHYALTTDLTESATGQSCLNIGGPNVSLDCGGHTITAVAGASAIGVTNAQSVSISNCNLVGGGTTLAALDVSGSQGVTVTNATVTSIAHGSAAVFIDTSTNVALTNSTLVVNEAPVPAGQQPAYAAISVNQTQQIQLLNNQVTSSATAYNLVTASLAMVMGNTLTGSGGYTNTGPEIICNSGNHNTISNNTINGMATGQWQGAEDGIELISENSDVVQANRISSLWDAGIETAGYFTNSTIVSRLSDS